MQAPLLTYVLRHLIRRPLRLALALVSLALGVAVVVAIYLLNLSTVQALADSLAAISGPATLRIEGTSAGLPLDLADEVSRLAGVTAALPLVEARVTAPAAGPGLLVLLGVDARDVQALGVHALGELGLETLALLFTRPDAVLVCEPLARRMQLEPGDTFTLLTPLGPRPVFVAGTVPATGPFTVIGDSLLLAPLPRAQRLAGRGHRVDRIDLVTDPLRVEEVARRVEAHLGDGGPQVRRPEQRGREVERVLFGLRAMCSVISVFALLAGAFLVFNTVSVSLTERRRDLAMLRAVGATRSQLGGVLLAEQALLGALGGGLGLALGLAGARYSTALLAQAITRAYVTLRLPEATLTPGAVLLAMGAGALAALGAALVPVRREIGGDPLAGLRGRPPGGGQPLGWRRRTTLLLVCSAAVLGLVVWGPGRVPHAVILGGVLSLGWLFLGAGPVGRLLVSRAAVVWRRLLGLPGQLAALGFERAGERSVLTVLAVGVGCGLVFEVQTSFTSSRAAVLDWVERTVVGDLMVTRVGLLEPSANLPPLGPGVPERLRALAGVRNAAEVRLARVTQEGEQILLLGLGARPGGRSFTFRGGNPERALAGYRAGRGVLVSESYRATCGRGVGDLVELPTPAGPATLPILGVVVDYSWPRGVICLEIGRYRELLGDPLVDEVILDLEPGADPAAVRARCREALGRDYPDLCLVTGAEFRRECHAILDGFFGLSRAQSLVTLAVAFFGVLGALVIMVLLRERELAVLRALGATRVQVSLTLALEGAFIGLVGSVCGVVFGGWIGFLAMRYASLEEQGWAIPVRYPVLQGLLLCAACVLTALVAALLPALGATRWSERSLAALSREAS